MTKITDATLDQSDTTVEPCEATLVGPVDVRIGPYEERIPAAVVSRCGVLVLIPMVSNVRELPPENPEHLPHRCPLTTAVGSVSALLTAYGIPPWVGGAVISPETAETVVAEFITNSRSGSAAHRGYVTFAGAHRRVRHARTAIRTN